MGKIIKFTLQDVRDSQEELDEIIKSDPLFKKEFENLKNQFAELAKKSRENLIESANKSDKECK